VKWALRERRNVMRYWLKACPRCKAGDLKEEADPFGRYIACVQCGHILNVMQETELWAGTPEAEKAAAEREPVAA
jgi:hypothetical protein